MELGLRFAFKTHTHTHTHTHKMIFSSRFSSCFFRTCMCTCQRKWERKRVGFADTPLSSNSISRPPDALTTTLVLSLHTPCCWGASLVSQGSFLYSSFPHSLHPDHQLVLSALPPKTPWLTALWLWVSHRITVCLPSTSDPSCSPKIRPYPSSLRNPFRT